MEECGVDDLPFLSHMSDLKDCYLQYTNFLSLSDKESAIAIIVFPIHASEKQGEIKAAPLVTRLLYSLSP